MSDREPTHSTSPATALAPAAISEPKPLPSTLAAATQHLDLVAPSTLTPSEPSLSQDLEEEAEVELLDWDEDGIDDSPAAGVEAADAGSTITPALEEEILTPMPGNLATDELLKQSDITPPSRAGSEGKACAGAAPDAHLGRPSSASNAPAALATALRLDVEAAPPLPQPPVPEPVGAKASEKFPPAKLMFVLVWPARQPVAPPRAGKRI